MMLDGNNRSAAINWIREDLDACLAEVREGLEDYAEDTTVAEPLERVQQRLRQLNLTFSTMEQYGAGILTDEMIAVGDHMLNNGRAGCEDSLSALTDAVIVLPSYLDRLQAGHEDLPVLLLPTLNELRATYDESLMSEGALFAPTLDVMIPELSNCEATVVPELEFNRYARRTRMQFQQALLSWLQEQSKVTRLEPLQQVCGELYIRLGRHDLRRLWWVAESVVKGLRDAAIDNDLPLRRLFARLDLTLKSMCDSGEEGPTAEAVMALSRALLFYAAQARPGSSATDRLRERFRLEELIPDREALLRAKGAVTGRDAELFESIGVAVREELNLVKDALDMELRTGRVEQDQRETSVASLQQLADTLEMLNLPVPARAVADLLSALQETGGEDGEVNTDLDSPLLALAQRLLEVEQILDTHISLLGEPVTEDEETAESGLPSHEEQLVFARLLDECVSDLHQVQESVRCRIEGDESANYGEPLERIRGALILSTQEDVAELTNKLERSLNAHLLGGDGAGDTLEALADAIAALELYLTGRRDEQENSRNYLNIMQQRLEGLPEADADGAELESTRVELRQAPPSKPSTPATPAAEASDTVDEDMLAVFLEEFDGVLATLREQLDAWLDDAQNSSALGEIKRGFHTLKGSGRMIGAVEIGDFAWRMESLLNSVVEGKIPFSDAIGDAATLAVGMLEDLKSRLTQQPTDLTADAVAAVSEFARGLEDAQELSAASLEGRLPARILGAVMEVTEDETPAVDAAPEIDPMLADLMRSEIADLLAPLGAFAEQLTAGGEVPADSQHIHAAHTLAGVFAQAPLGDEAELSRELEDWLRVLSDKDISASAGDAPVIARCLERFRQRLAVLEGGDPPASPVDPELIQSLRDMRFAVGKEDPMRTAAESGAAAMSDSKPASAPASDIAAETPAEAPQAEAPEAESVAADDPRRIEIEDGGILSIFLEEATEVLERCDTLLNTWRDNLSDSKLIQSLQREIHTFKGGARMAGLEDLGELSHAMETLMESIAEKRLTATVAAVQALEEGCDHLTMGVEELQTGLMPDTTPAIRRFEQRLEVLTGKRSAIEDEPIETESLQREPASPAADAEPEEVVAEAAEQLPEAEAPAEPVATDTQAEAPAAPEIPAAPPRKVEFRDVPDRPAAAESDDSGAQTQIRVAAELMDRLVNQAGEISIYRSRIEQQLGQARFNLKEVAQTVERLQEQLRKMSMEAEAQMASRYQRASEGSSTEFDPLELDRFSNMQQLSRSLTESVSDLVNLRDMLDDSLREAEALAVQQSRVSTDLQEGLMQTRMTPFGSAAPRLRRVVRTAAQESDKLARLQLRMAGSSDQLDRNVLERITAPLEHMLRNSVVHGIESPRARRKLGKPEEGQIAVSVSSEATEFVVRVEDDGAGINLEAVRKRAIERGLMAADDELSDRELSSFIMRSGFSTSEKVTGLAGRGVGMDVVNNEIRTIGGSMEIHSETGVGTCFTIRIPFSLSVMQAIGVTVGKRPFLVPLNSVAGVARMTPAEYAALAAAESPQYEFAGESFPVLEMEPLLGEPASKPDSDTVSLLMIRAGEQQAAFRVNDLQGHQEVVIKPVGPQISSIPGILGGTISADGQVVIILDMGPMIRRGLEMAADPSQQVAPVREEARAPLVMVVDDSITMRKVTSRVLENHRLDVMTAQDGLDAIEKLHEQVPDLILLDIEMPRMDGYELAQHVRSDARLRHVPIVMITSRAGQKHRRKARKAGANDYMTKPYQEADLVTKVEEMLEIKLQPGSSDR